MSNYFINIELLSDTTFGRGDGVAGLIDQEVEHDSYGFPYLRGRTLKGLLSEECDNLLCLIPDPQEHWLNARNSLLGKAGSTIETQSRMHVGDACLPDDLRREVAKQFELEKYRGKITLTPTDILSSLTTFRRQTAIDSKEGVAKDKSLRSSRVVLRELCFKAPITLNLKPSDDSQKILALLAVSVLALRRIGSGRNRGRGHVKCTLWQRQENQNPEEITTKHLRYLEQETKA
ncbi:RAMP superfamily CRISPR-associated protein [Kamptonema sp. UHCC 0994]|uniref:RAMP superfamily CRISPR-associated protein n=1 Tax=Kamptonema sp. UHCC 0994 TaxID=3031329 RepID=UPI0023BAB16C|nr:RAMP superfamily CRISPR-associated protein [Kamptonema sp. UHCC 0994]MDF0556437.1 RAMP superfamily CRISPR-associated protein [Kamptonema sp. UHCC 0994]